MRLQRTAIRFLSVIMTVVMIFMFVAPTVSALTMDDIGETIGPIASQYADAYKEAYKQAKEDGVIDQINFLFDEASSVFSRIMEWVGQNEELVANPELSASLNVMAQNAKVTIESLRELVNNADEIDGETAAYAMTLLNSLYVNATNLFDVLMVVAEQAGEYIDPETAEIIKNAQESIAQLQKDATEAIIELQGQAEEMIAGIVKEAEAKIADLQKNAAAHLEALNELLKTANEDSKEAILAEIAEIEAQLRADIAEIEKMLEEETAAVTMWLLDAIAQINQKLNIDIEAVITKLGDMVSAIKSVVGEILKLAENNETIKSALKFIEAEMNKMWESANNYIKDLFRQYTTSSYRVKDSSFYLAIGNDTVYAQMFADNIYLKPEQFMTLSWEEIDEEMIKKADLISVSFNEDQLSGFAVNQALGYVADYINSDLRGDFTEYVAAAMTKLLSSTTPAFKPSLVEKCVESITEAVDLGIDQFCEVQLGGNTAEELDWASIVGEENVASIDNTRMLLQDKLFASGIEEVYLYEISVVDIIYDNLDILGDGVGFFLKYIDKEDIISLLGEYATYTVRIPLSDAIMFAGESFIYSYARFTQNYAQTVTKIQELNPNANIVLLGHYNSFNGIAITIGESTIDFGAIYKDFARLTCIHPFAYAVFMDNVTYIDIFDVETIYGSKIAAGEETDALDFVFKYMTDRSLTNASEAGHAYICGKMLEAISVERGDPPPSPPPAVEDDGMALWLKIVIVVISVIVIVLVLILIRRSNIKKKDSGEEKDEKSDKSEKSIDKNGDKDKSKNKKNKKE